ncbi:MAG: ABC transporter permease [Planctomycetes bacterium]|nr:ABC transporter permease [Planctomycetota bacterium]
MFLFLVWRDVKVRYKQTVIGAAWAILQPLTSMIIFSLIFGRVAGIPSDGVPYPLFVFAGILPWTFFSTAVSQAGVSLVNQAQLVTKVYFPRLLVPASSIGVGLVDFGLGLVVYVGIMCWYAHLPALTVLLLPLLLLLMVVAGLGVGYLLASVTVIYRDFRLAIPFMIQAWMFLSPVVYPVSFLPESYRWALALNPMTGIIEAFRSVLLNRPLDLGLLGVAALVSLTVFVVGVYRFRLAERRFADIV